MGSMKYFRELTLGIFYNEAVRTNSVIENMVEFRFYLYIWIKNSF